nr:ADP-ribosylglycohydrolase family protein [Burkholderia sp. IDO3]
MARHADAIRLVCTGYEDCVKHAIALGNDTDTTAAIAGSLAGALYGEQALPDRWVAMLRGKGMVEGWLTQA